MADSFQPKFVDLVRNYCTTVGTGNFTLGPAVNGYSGFAAACQAGDSFYYSAIGVDKPAETEVGRGTLLADGTISRDPISGKKTNFSSGTKSIALIAAAEWFTNANAVQSDQGSTLIKHKRASQSGVPTYARSLAELKALGADDSGGINLVHFLDPQDDDALLAGDSSVDRGVAIQNACDELAAIKASTGRPQKLIMPAFIFPVAGGTELNFAADDLTIDAYGAEIRSEETGFLAVLSLNGNRMTVNGLTFNMTGTDGDPAPSFDVNGTDIRLNNVDVRRAAPMHIPVYVRGSGLEWRGGGVYGSKGINCFNVERLKFIGINVIGAGAEFGTDDGIALKAFTGSYSDFEVIGCYFENCADFLGIGSQVGKLGGPDPSYSNGIYKVVMEGCTGTNCTSILLIKPGAIDGDDYDFRDGRVAQVSVINTHLRDPLGTELQRPINILAGRGAQVSDVEFDVTVNGRSAIGNGARRAGILDLYLPDLGTKYPGSGQAKVSGVRAKGRFNDPFDGVAGGATAPGVSMPTLVNVEKENPNAGSVSGVVLDISGNGTQFDGIFVGPGVNNGVHVARARMTNIDNDTSSSFGGIRTGSIITASNDVDVDFAAGSSGMKYVLFGSGDIITKGEFAGNSPTITMRGHTGNAGIINGLGGIVLQHGGAAKVSTKATGIDVAGQADLTGRVSVTGPNLPSLFTNSSGSPTNTAMLEFVRASNIATPAATGAALLITDHQNNYGIVLRNATGAVRFQVGPSGNTTVGGTLTIGGTQVFSATGALQAAAFPALTGDVTTAAGGVATSIAANAVTFAKLQQISSGTLLGNPANVSGNAQAIALGGGLVFSGATLSVGALTPASVAATGGLSSSGGGIGYAAGAGGAVVQATSKSTGVTLNKLCGQITTAAAALAANAAVSFTVTNSQIAATDTIDLVLQSGNATAGTYSYQVDKVSAGSFVIWIKNISAASLSEALSFNFSVKKAVAA